MQPRLSGSVWILTALAICCFGCGKAGPTTVKVTGIVQFDGKALTKGTITFLPQGVGAGEENRPAIGTINADGQFELSTFKPGDGAMPGKYLVTVVSNSSEPTLEEVAEKGATVVSAIPAGYNSPVTSGLTATVEDGGNPVEIDFALKTGGAPDTVPVPGRGPVVDQFGT